MLTRDSLFMVDLAPAYDGSGVQMLVEKFETLLALGTVGFDPAGHDRSLDRMFDGDTVINVSDAVIRFLAHYGPLTAELAGHALAWGVLTGLVAYDGTGAGLRFKRLHYGVAFVPRGRAGLDVRVDAPSGGKLSRRSLAKRESKYREQERSTLGALVDSAVRDALQELDGNTSLPKALVSTDLPPVRTTGELHNSLSNWLYGMPVWRRVEIWWHVQELLQRQRQWRRIAPAELNNFSL